MVKIRILGTKGEIEEESPEHRKQSGVLIDKVLFDCGEVSYLDLKPEVIFVSHGHPDHIKGLEASGEVPVYSLEKPPVEGIVWRKISPRKKYRAGEIFVIPVPTIHSKIKRSCGFLIFAGGKKILYTGDMISINKRWYALIRDPDLVITEGSSFDRDLIRRDKETGEIYGHSSIPRLVSLFKRLNAKTIVIAHYGSWLVKKPEEGYRKIKELSDQVKVWPAKDGEEIDLEELAITPEDLPEGVQIIPGKVREEVCPVCSEIFASLRALLNHIKREHPQEYTYWKEVLSEPRRGIHLVTPHARWIWEGKKTAFVKSREYRILPGGRFYLLGENKCFGVIEVGEGKKINLDEFRELYPAHQITEEMREQWSKKYGGWKTGPLFFYPVKLVEKYGVPLDVELPKGPQMFIDKKNIIFKTQIQEESLQFREELIPFWKTYNPVKLITTERGRKALAQDHLIVHAWMNRLKKGQAMKSEQFRKYSLEEQKGIVKMLHEKIADTFKKLGWKHSTPLSGELPVDPAKVEVKDLEGVNDQYIAELTDKQLILLYNRLHWLYHNILKRVTEPLLNAHIFVLRSLNSRNLSYEKIEDRLQIITERIVTEYPTPKGFASAEVNPGIILDELSREVSLAEVIDKFPDLIVLEEDPIHVFLCGGLVNRGKALPKHDIDILFKQSFPDPRIVHQFVNDLSTQDKELARRLHFVWDPHGPTIGHSAGIYRLAFKKLPFEEIRKSSPSDYLAGGGQAIQVMKPYRMLKPKSGFHKAEFFDVQEFWDKWAAAVIDRGLLIQKKYDGMRFQVHVKGNEIKIITEDKLRDRAVMFPKCIRELLDKKTAESFVLDAEMVEYNCFSKDIRDKEEFCEALKREQMIPWIAVTKRVLDDEDIVFHIHDCVYFNGEDIHEKGYEERWDLIKKCFPSGLRHWRRVESSYADSPRDFFRAVKKERTRPGSEGAVAKIKDSAYKLTGRTGDWAKIKNLKNLSVMVWDIEQKKTKEGVPLQQWIYYPVFLVPCNMRDQIREDQFIEWKGRCYARIGRAYGTKVKCERGDIIDVRPVQILENKDPKTGKLWWSWMFPYFEAKRPEKKEPDTITTVRRIVKVGTAPLPEELERLKILLLPSCPYWKDGVICPLRERFWVPPEKGEESLRVLEEYLKFPIGCKLANRFKCHFVKDYYYDLRSSRDYTLKRKVKKVKEGMGEDATG